MKQAWHLGEGRSGTERLPGIALLALAFLAAGCAMTKPPVQRDAGYPADWPGIDSQAVECNWLEGTYNNQGTVVDRKGTARGICLTDILLQRSSATSDSVSLLVVPQKGSADKTIPAKLRIKYGKEDGDGAELNDCFWLKHGLLCAGVQKPSGGFPYLGLTGSQQNVWLVRGTDGSLLVKVWDYSAGAVLVVPCYHQSCAWARFERLK